jgi:phosphoenolpyruvate-protein kinase (PTS system EI component)
MDGAPFAHDSIPLLATGIPTVMLDSDQAALLEPGTDVIIDGTRGLVSNDSMSLSALAPQKPLAQPLSACRTSDGIDIRLRISLREQHAAELAQRSGAEAIGLVRSEFLSASDGRIPDEDFYRQVFAAICQAAAPLPVTIRLLDIAADKLPPWLPRLEGTGSPLGLQGIRLYSYEPVRSVYRAQLAAIDALRKEYEIRVLIPSLANRQELLEWVTQVRQMVSRPLSLGAMAETPAAALQLAPWFEQVDLVALGCNDLMQCLFGADRDLPALRSYLDPYCPALYCFLRQVAQSAAAYLPRVQLCGVLPQLPGILPLLIGLGFRAFSVELGSLPYLRQTVAGISLSQAARLARRVCLAQDSIEVRRLVV